MVDKAQLPYLIKLIDDDSPRVRSRVAEMLREFGPSLHQDIRDQHLLISDHQRSILDDIVPTAATPRAKNPWLYWLHLEDEFAKLEAAFALLADWQSGRDYLVHLPQLLDSLADEFREAGYDLDYEELSDFLFIHKALHGAPPDEYYNSHNSNLVKVVELRRGLQISLASLFMLVGKRLGLEIHGLNFPGHFMARARIGERDLVFDCFNGGRLLSESETAALYKATPLEMSTPTPAVTMIARVLSNLAVAFDHENDPVKTQFILTLLSELQDAIRA